MPSLAVPALAPSQGGSDVVGVGLESGVLAHLDELKDEY